MHGITGINETMILHALLMTLAKEEATSWYVLSTRRGKEIHGLHNAIHKHLLVVYCKLCCNWHSSVDHGNTPCGPSQCE